MLWLQPRICIAVLGLVVLGAGAPPPAGVVPAPVEPARPPCVPACRVEAQGFGAGEADIRAVLDSAGGELFRFFPDYTIEPLAIVRGRSGPITLFQRNGRGEIVVQLDTGGTFWCQYAYQHAHELCHVLCGFRPGGERNKWFEETLCECASLFVMRAMARSWKDAPPYPNWRDYRDALRGYADDVIRNRKFMSEVYGSGLAGFYREHRAELERNPTDRELNGAMAVVFLQLLEENPARWEAIRWLNAKPAPPGEGFDACLARWRATVPERHRAFVTQVAKLYGVMLPAGP